MFCSGKPLKLTQASSFTHAEQQQRKDVREKKSDQNGVLRPSREWGFERGEIEHVINI